MRMCLCIGAALVGLVSLVPTMFAQSGNTTLAQDDRIVVGTNLVTVNVIVTDSKGSYVKGLGPDEFEIYDNRVKQRIVHFSSDAFFSFNRYHFRNPSKQTGKHSRYKAKDSDQI